MSEDIDSLRIAVQNAHERIDMLHERLRQAETMAARNITMRDHFAALAMGGMWATSHSIGSYGDVSRDAYKQADAMLAAREAKHEPQT